MTESVITFPSKVHTCMYIGKAVFRKVNFMQSNKCEYTYRT